MQMNKKQTSVALPALLAAAVLVAAGCGGSGGSSSTNGASGSGGGSSKVLVGAGSTFVYPLVSQWIPDYSKKKDVTVTYGPVGSGAGIEQIINRTIDFGASDAPLTPDEASQCKGCLQVPWALSATSIDYNLKGAPDHLQLTGPVIADIYLGKIKSWDDAAIKQLNPGVTLPSTPISVIHRSDGSGTTFNVTDYLSHVSPAWKQKVGSGTSVSWPAGQGGKGSSGVSAVLARTDGGITYTDVAYALANHFHVAALQNRAGKLVVPSLPSITAAAGSVDNLPADNAISIVDPPASAASAYPISTYTYAIVPQSSPKAATLTAFLTYAIGPGQQFGPKLLFAPLPEQIVARDKQTIARIGS
jgi:phosphate transport system substrate-binding protein